MTTVYNNDILFFDGINVLDLALLNQTPFYLYSEKMIANNFLAYQKSFKDNRYFFGFDIMPVCKGCFFFEEKKYCR